MPLVAQWLVEGESDVMTDPAGVPEPARYDWLVLRWASAVLTAVLIAALAFGLWWVASPGLAEGDRLGFGLLVVLFGLLSGIVAYGQGLWAGHDRERDAARRATAELQARRDRMDAQLAARRTERDQLLAGAAPNPRLAGENPRLTGRPPP